MSTLIHHQLKMELNPASQNSEILSKLKAFNNEFTAPTNPVKLTSQEHENLLEFLLKDVLTLESRRECFATVLTTVKILSRNRTIVNSVLTSDSMDTLLSHAGLLGEKSMSNRYNKEERDFTVILESLRCLSNIYLQSSCAQNYGVENQTIPSVIEQTKVYKDLEIPNEVISSDVKLVFLITAHRPEARSVVRVHHEGIKRFSSVLELILNEAKDRSINEEAKPSCPTLNDDEVMVITDTLKLMFNLSINNEMNEDSDDSAEKTDLINLARIVSILLTMETRSEEKKGQVVSSCINLLTNHPLNCMEPLRSPLNKDFTDLRPIIFEGAYMNGVTIILQYLSGILENTSRNNLDLRDTAAPTMKVLVCLAKSDRVIRRYLRYTILPPLKEKDIKTRPEEGNTMRNKLCRMLTSPDTSMSTIAAELLFVLCKEKVGRFVKHTGYGNAAGLLARRGLMLGGHGDTQYSTTDDDSETDEYSENAHLVNPITGYMDIQDRPNPFADMSDEQKEYEAVKLANLIDKLHNMGVVRPARIDETGQPVEVDHVLQLIDDEDVLIRNRGRISELDKSDSD